MSDIEARLEVLEENQMNILTQLTELQEVVTVLYDQLPELLCNELQSRMIETAELLKSEKQI